MKTQERLRALTHEDVLFVLPSQVFYTESSVIVGNHEYEAKNPRFEFARVLGLFPDATNWEKENDSIVRSNTIVGERVLLGLNCVIGGNGFGFVKDDNGKLFRMPHLGNVVIGNDVEIHNQVSIDRAVTESTIIGDGTKIDNLVHIAHGVKVGKNCQIVAGSVIGGSCEIGDGTFIGINSSIRHKIKIGKNAMIGMDATVLADVPDGFTVYGIWKGKR